MLARLNRRAGFSVGWHPADWHPETVRQLLWCCPVVAAISIFYLFLASAGTFTDLPSQLAYYDKMAEGFRLGHLYIQQVPSAKLLAQADPFRFENYPLWLWDAALYKGHYYLYWGPVPALFLLAYKLATGTREIITDQWPTALFMIGRLWAGAALILGFASRVRLRQAPWVCALVIAVFGLANPTPFVVARPHVYEAALAGGQCFLVWGLAFVFFGLEYERRRGLLFTLGGVAWALAIGCRVTSVLCVPLLMLFSAGCAWYRSSRALRPFLLQCLGLGLPVAAGCAAYGWYNYARFDSVSEFGVSYQLTMQPFYGHDAYVVLNIYSYLFAPISWSCHFPFARILGYRPLSPLLEWPATYQNFERVGGIMLSAAWCWFVLLSVWHIAAYVWTRRRRLRPGGALTDISSQEAWLLSSSVALMVAMVPVLPLWMASMRYMEDAIGGIILIGIVGAFWLLRVTRLRSRWLRFATRGFVTLVAVQTCVVGALAGFSSYTDSFKWGNPVLYGRLEGALSLCPAPTKDWP
jgi:hypothetical protein